MLTLYLGGFGGFLCDDEGGFNPMGEEEATNIERLRAIDQRCDFWGSQMRLVELLSGSEGGNQ